MLKQALSRVLRAGANSARNPAFWISLLALALALALAIFALGAVALMAVERFDAYLRLRPLVCEDGISDRQFLVVAMAAPLWLLFTLTTIGEAWEQAERRRAGQAVRWFHFAVFLLLASALGGVVLLGLGC